MRKIIFSLLFFSVFWLFSNTAHAKTNYQTFESLALESGELLADFSSADLKKYYQKVDSRKFMGWRTYTVHKNIKVSYVTETLFSYYNDGYTPIKYSYKLDSKTSTKLKLTATGSIGIKTQNTKQNFKNNLDGALKLTAEYQTTGDTSETYSVSLEVDPGTQVDLYIYGEGVITNGVAANYLFWIRTHRGGFEAFAVTTQYQRLEKKKI